MSFLAPVAMIAGTLFQGVSALGQGLYQAQVAKNNAAIAARNANVASDQAQIAQQRSDREYAAQRGAYIADTGASGASVNSGSVTDVLGMINRNQNEAAVDIRRQGEAQSIGFNNQAAAYKGQANAATSAAIGSMIGSVFKAVGQGADAFGGGQGSSGYSLKSGADFSSRDFSSAGPNYDFSTSSLGTRKRAYPWAF